MACPWFNQEKDSVWDGIYCNRKGGRVPVKFWDCYCKYNCERCPYNGGDDPEELVYQKKEETKKESDWEEYYVPTREGRSNQKKTGGYGVPDNEAGGAAGGAAGGVSGEGPGGGFIAFRIWLPIVAIFLFMEADTINYVEKLIVLPFMLFSVGQAVSLILGAACKHKKKARVIVWLVNLLFLAVFGLIVWKNWSAALAFTLAMFVIGPPAAIFLIWLAFTRFLL